jgi:predicted transcriptional regulator
MIHKNDEIKRRFYQVDKLLLENPKYEELSEGAVLTWAILRDRMELSKLNSEVYSDEEGYLFLIFTDEELAEIIHRSRKTANLRKKELEKFGLLYNVRMGLQQPNRIYLLEPEVCDPSEYLTEKYRKKKKAEQVKKEISKAKAQKKKYVMIEIDEDEKSYPQAQTLGGELMGKNVTSVMSKNVTSVMSKNVTSRRVESLHPDVTNLPTNDTDLNDLELKDTEVFEEEEKNINLYFSKLIKEVLGSEGVYDEIMIARIILEMKHADVSFLTKKEMLEQHRKMDKKRDEGEDIWDWAKYFVGGIVKNRLSESSAVRQGRLDEAKKFKKFTQDPSIDLPFYNWLEE